MSGHPSGWSMAGSTLLFSAEGRGAGVELWTIDGTEQGTFATSGLGVRVLATLRGIPSPAARKRPSA